MKEFFTNRVSQFENRAYDLQKRSNLYSYLRLFIFLSGSVATFASFSHINEYPFFTIAPFAFLVSFVYLVLLHSRLKENKKNAAAMTQINKMYIKRAEGNWHEFKDEGKEFYSREHPYASDLDLYGFKSLYQFINTGRTFYGRKELRNFFEDPDSRPHTIRSRQDAVRELSQKLDFLQKIECEGIDLNAETDLPARIKTLNKKYSEIVKDHMHFFYYTLPSLILFLLLLKIGFQKIPLFLPLGLILIQISYWIFGYGKITAVLSQIAAVRRDLTAYKKILLLIEKEEFNSEYLKKLKSNLKNSGYASKGIKNLEAIADRINIRMSPLLQFLLNALFLFDYHAVISLKKWNKNYGEDIINWFSVIGSLEALSGYAVLHLIHPDWKFPEIIENGPALFGKNVGHPLIPKSECIRNDLDFNGGVNIVTGSNMSGKTTFLRAIGLNLVLAYGGAPVCAEEFRCSVMTVHTSMRISDDLSSGISTFYAELLRIKKIIEYSKTTNPMIYLIDELFRGTNSADRITGAKSVIHALSQEWTMGFISTHDHELSESREKIPVNNFHFKEEYSDNKILFDYKLRSGSCDSRNAVYLMRMLGIEVSE
ncbi:MAG: DNA mismatch repair protein MutS [Spirochaetia bacterium]|nr:DNA mismatch repair protein MutS [Spirochaetia bacterium]